MVDVVRGVYLPWDPDSESISIRTDSVEGSEEKVWVRFYNDKTDIAGGVIIRFDRVHDRMVLLPLLHPLPCVTSNTDREDMEGNLLPC